MDKIAVVDIAGDIQGETAKNQVADYFAMELARSGYTPVERQQVMSLLVEQNFQGMEDVTSAQGAAQAGKIANVPHVLVANVQYGEQIAMTAKIIDVETGSMIWVGSGSGKTLKGLPMVLGAVAGAGGGVAAGGSSTGGRVAGGVAGGVLGGVAGEALTPQQAEVVQKVIRKMCATFPMKAIAGR